MKIYQGIENFKTLDKAVVTTGTFDGVHVGHHIILDRLIELAKKIDGESVLLTFYPHPRMVLQPDTDIKLLNTIEEKTALLENAGIDHLIIHPFTKEFSRTTSLEFVRDILVNKIGTKKLVIGYDHHFGRNREGSFEHLKEYGPLYGFDVEEIPAQDIDNVNVSSTKIRKAIAEGNVAKATEYLGHQFQLTGTVVHGNKIGRQLGYPTANLDLNNKYKIIPANGIYAVQVVYKGDSYNGLLNIGYRPTIQSEAKKLSIEVFIIDFEKEIYGEELKVYLIHRIREEKKFESKKQLITAMDADLAKAKLIFNKTK